MAAPEPVSAKTSYAVLDREALPRDGYTREFQGIDHQDTEISFIWVDMPAGKRVRLHKHPYKEIFIIQEGSALFTVGTESLEAHAGQVIMVPAETPHMFKSLGPGQLRQVDIHMNRQFITDWLED